MNNPTPTTRILHYGTDEALPENILLHAGPLTAVYDNGDLRYIRLGNVEILRRVYAAVRDHNWGTVAPRLSNVRLDVSETTFDIRYESTHQQDDIDFVWHGTITGSADGVIVFQFDGEARSTFRRNRIGFCVLHPMTLAGQPCTITQVDGSVLDGIFPKHVLPHPPFFNIRAMTHEVSSGLRVEVLMEGDTFEMEDQRNWTDASYKTYCTPLGQPFPVEVAAGTTISQRITVRLLDNVPVASSSEDIAAPLTLTISADTEALPRIGLEIATNGHPLNSTEIEHLRALKLDHLRVVLRLYEPDASTVLLEATDQANVLGVPLEIALWLSDKAEQELDDLRAVLDRINSLVWAWLVFKQGHKSTPASLVRLVRDRLGDYAPMALIGGGTDAFFAELNRNRPPVEDLDFVSFSVNPQVHAFANKDLVETLAAQAAVVQSAKLFSHGLPVAISPVTFFSRWNPNATGPEPPTSPGELPARVDPRQMSLFGAGWTLGSLKYLAESGALSTTFFETVGWLGVMEQREGSLLPDKFVSMPGCVFPMYHVFAAAGDFAGGSVRISHSSDPLVVDVLVLVKDERIRVLLANYTAEMQEVKVSGLSGSLRIKFLDETNVVDAMCNPADFRDAAGYDLQSEGHDPVVRLKPFAIAQIDG